MERRHIRKNRVSGHLESGGIADEFLPVDHPVKDSLFSMSFPIHQRANLFRHPVQDALFYRRTQKWKGRIKRIAVPDRNGSFEKNGKRYELSVEILKNQPCFVSRVCIAKRMNPLFRAPRVPFLHHCAAQRFAEAGQPFNLLG